MKQLVHEARSSDTISLNQPNEETVAAMLEAEHLAKDDSVKGYTDLEQLFTELRQNAKHG